MNRRSRIAILAWAYTGELVLSGIGAVLVQHFVPDRLLTLVLVDAAGTWMVILTILAALAIAVLCAFYTMTQNDFGVWLKEKKAFGVYVFAFSSALMVFLGGILVFLVLKGTAARTTILVAGATVLIYTCIVLITLLTNMHGFALLSLDYRQKQQET